MREGNFGKINPADVKAMLENADLNKVQQKLQQLDQRDISRMAEQIGSDQIQALLGSDARREVEQMLSRRPDIKQKLQQMMKDNNFR